ncbi:MAG: hypothetical protein EUB_00226 [Eubacterium sp.]|uniref:hypothetical protein n=1 Tax=Eubacterium sp. TaxID=142586 RepID=UPI00305C2DEA
MSRKQYLFILFPKKKSVPKNLDKEGKVDNTEIFEAACEFYATESLRETQIFNEPGMPAIDKLHYFIQYLFDYTLKHKEFESNYHENSEIRASRIDKVAAKMVENLIPIMEEGIREGTFHCENLQTTARFIVFGMLHTFHDEIPEKNIEAYIQHFVIFIRKILIFLTIKTDWVVLKVNEFTRIQNLCQIIQQGKTI